MKKLLTHTKIYKEGSFTPGSVLLSGERIEAVYTGDAGSGGGTVALGDSVAGAGIENLGSPAAGAGVEHLGSLVAGAEVVNLGGKYLLPGFVDTHFHLTSQALKALRCDLSATRSAEDLVEALAAYAQHGDESHVMGVEWDESHWDDPTPPTRRMLDDVDATRPVLARRICGHIGVANTVLLDRLTAHADLIDRDSGLLREHALWAGAAVCAVNNEKMSRGFEAAIERLHALGVTAIHDIVEPGRVDAYIEGVRSSSAPLRIDALLHVHPRDVDEYVAKFSELDSSVTRLAGVKCFLDGSLGGRTAALNERYTDDEGRGQLLIGDDELRSIARGAYERKLVCAMHAIGDRAIDQALDVLEEFPGDAAHFRIEHCEIVDKRQLDRLVAAPVYLAMQPNFVRNWGMEGGMYERCLGRKRFRSSNPFRSLKSRGVELIFGSDGMPPGPLYGLAGATGHPVESERLSPAEAIDAYTRWPNEVGLFEREAGVIEPGRLADLIVLGADPMVADVGGAHVERTYIGGAVVFEAGARSEVT